MKQKSPKIQEQNDTQAKASVGCRSVQARAPYVYFDDCGWRTTSLGSRFSIADGLNFSVDEDGV